MAGTPLFLACQTCNIFFVVSLQVVFVQLDTGQDVGHVEHGIFNGCLLGLLKHRRVRSVISVQIGIGHLHLAGKVFRKKVRHLDFAALKQGIQGDICLRIAAECRTHHRAQDLIDGHVTAHAGFKPFRRHALCAHEGTVSLGIQRTVGSAQGGDLRNFLQAACQPCVARSQVHFLRGDLQYAVAHHALQRGVVRNWRIEQLGIHAGLLRTNSVCFDAVRVVPLCLGDVVAVHPCHHRAPP